MMMTTLLCKHNGISQQNMFKKSAYLKWPKLYYLGVSSVDYFNVSVKLIKNTFPSSEYTIVQIIHL